MESKLNWMTCTNRPCVGSRWLWRCEEDSHGGLVLRGLEGRVSPETACCSRLRCVTILGTPEHHVHIPGDIRAVTTSPTPFIGTLQRQPPLDSSCDYRNTLYKMWCLPQSAPSAQYSGLETSRKITTARASGEHWAVVAAGVSCCWCGRPPDDRDPQSPYSSYACLGSCSISEFFNND